jgi:hypothetical protein
MSPDATVPSAGATRTGLLLRTTLEVPVEVVTPVPPCSTGRVVVSVTPPDTARVPVTVAPVAVTSTMEVEPERNERFPLESPVIAIPPPDVKALIVELIIRYPL